MLANASVTKSAPDNVNSLNEFFMANTKVNWISEMQGN